MQQTLETPKSKKGNFQNGKSGHSQFPMGNRVEELHGNHKSVIADIEDKGISALKAEGGPFMETATEFFKKGTSYVSDNRKTVAIVAAATAGVVVGGYFLAKKFRAQQHSPM